MKRTHGIAPLVIIVVLAASALGLWVAKPKFLHGASQRAAASTTATANLESTVIKQGGEVAASVEKIGEANAAAPESLEKNFIAREVPVALSKLPAPDPTALIEAEKRKSAILEGRAAEAERLYTTASQHSADLEKKLNAAVSDRRQADLNLETSAAAERAAEQQRNIFILVGVACLALYIYTKVTHLSPSALAEAVADIRAGHPAVQALDTVTSRLQQKMIGTLAFLRTRNSPAEPPK